VVEEYNHVLPDTDSHGQATRGDGSQQFSESIHFRR
jgi:hypothetical protein